MAGGFASFIEWRLDSNLDKPLMNVLHFSIPKQRTVAIRGIVFQQVVIMFEMRAASAGVCNNGVELFGRKLIDLLSCQALCQFPFTVVGVKRSAAILFGRSHNFTAVSR